MKDSCGIPLDEIVELDRKIDDLLISAEMHERLFSNDYQSFCAYLKENGFDDAKIKEESGHPSRVHFMHEFRRKAIARAKS